MGVMVTQGIVIGCISALFECFIVSRVGFLFNLYNNGFTTPLWYSKEKGIHSKHIEGKEVSLWVSVVTAFFGAAGGGGGVAFAIAPAVAVFVSEALWVPFRAAADPKNKPKIDAAKQGAREVNQHLVRPVGQGVKLVGKVGWAGVQGLIWCSKKSAEKVQQYQSKRAA